MISSLYRLSLLSLASLAFACGTPGDDRKDKDDDNKCQPACTGATCGQSDGCGGTCAGSCEGALVCSAAKVCEEPEEQCVPSCATAACGAADGCGGTCFGTCEDGLSCNGTTKTCEALGDCLLPSSLGALGALSGESMGDEFGADFYAGLVADADEAGIVVSLWDGYGAFESGLKTGSVTLIGDEMSAETCGACLHIYVTKGDKHVSYMPKSGTLALSSVTGRMTGSLSDVVFREVLIDEETDETTEVPGGCTTQVTSASFDAEIMPLEE